MMDCVRASISRSGLLSPSRLWLWFSSPAVLSAVGFLGAEMLDLVSTAGKARGWMGREGGRGWRIDYAHGSVVVEIRNKERKGVYVDVLSGSLKEGY